MAGLAGAFDLKDEKQAKEYLDTLGIEYRFQCYHENLPDGCHRLADFLEAFRSDFTKARAVYKSNCYDAKFGHSCFKYGNYCLLGKAGEKSVDQAKDAFEKSCEYGYPSGCQNLALLFHSDNFEGERDHAKARDYFERGCGLGLDTSCFFASTLYLVGKPGVPKDMTKAFQFSKLACEKENMMGCVNLSQMYARGDGVEKNATLAKKYKEMAKAIHNSHTENERGIKMGQ